MSRPDAKQLAGIVAVAHGGTGAATAAANLVFAGPTAGGAAAPAFRALVAADVPASTLDITGLTAADPALGDESPIYDISASANRKVTLGKLGFLLTGLVGGRLTLTTGVPVTTADVTAAGTLYYALHIHDKIALYDGTRWTLYTFTERSLALTLTSGKNYDVFLYDNAGTLTLELSAAWTNDTTRADALARQDGVWCKSGALTRRYIGTIRASGTDTTEDSATKRFVWNLYNRAPRPLVKVGAGTNWTYSTTTWRQANADSQYQVEVVRGLDLDAMHLRAMAVVKNDTGAGVITGVGVDKTNGTDAQIFGGHPTPVVNAWVAIYAEYRGNPGAGYHYLSWVEYSEAVGTSTWYGYWWTAARPGLIGECMA